MLGQALAGFSNNLAALRDFVGVVDGLLKTHSKTVMVDHAHNLLPLLAAFQSLGIPESIDRATADKLTNLDVDKIKAHFHMNLDVGSSEDSDSRTVTIEITDKDVSKKFDQSLKAFISNINRQKYLYSSALVSLTSIVEWYISDLLHKYYELYPDSLGTKAPVFSLADLRAFDSIRDAERHLIETKVEDVLRSSLGDWISHLKNSLNLSLGYLDRDMGVLTEIFQRRNLLVHNGGKVNSIYLSKVPEEHRIGVTLGNEIAVDSTYIESAIDAIERNFLLIGADLWKTLDKKNNDRPEVLNRLAYSHLKDDRWSIAESLSYFSIRDKDTSELHRLTAQINYWQSLKWQGKYAQVADEIEKADFSAKDAVFQMSKAVLQGDVKSAVSLITTATKNGSLEAADLAEWPLFRELRETTPFRQLERRVISAAPRGSRPVPALSRRRTRTLPEGSAAVPSPEASPSNE
jgi:hypothetical protein